MSPQKPIHRVAIVGTGTIGASWATHYLARGFDVVGTDPAPGAETVLRAYVETAWDAVATLGLSDGASPDRLEFTADMREALAGAEFVQENAPERPELKIALFASIDDATSSDTIIASSSSGITMTEIQSRCRHPERTVIGHPLNPPHIIPLVEVVGGAATTPQTIQETISFYASAGKQPIHLKKELPGHVVNRLQSALYREVVYLIEQEVLEVADIDDLVSWGPGLRWGVMGPNLLWHLGGGQGGIRHFMENLMDPMAAAWSTLGDPELTPELKRKIVDGVQAETAGRSIDELAAQRDAMVLALQSIRAEYDESARRHDPQRKQHLL
jgi:carnitine 3-dehydrogenase